MNGLKSQNGSITLFVLIAMLFFLMYMVGMYMLSASSESSLVAQTRKNKRNI